MAIAGGVSGGEYILVLIEPQLEYYIKHGMTSRGPL
jgi:hypothetical protein